MKRLLERPSIIVHTIRRRLQQAYEHACSQTMVIEKNAARPAEGEPA